MKWFELSSCHFLFSLLPIQCALFILINHYFSCYWFRTELIYISDFRRWLLWPPCYEDFGVCSKPVSNLVAVSCCQKSIIYQFVCLIKTVNLSNVRTKYLYKRSLIYVWFFFRADLSKKHLNVNQKSNLPSLAMYTLPNNCWRTKKKYWNC